MHMHIQVNSLHASILVYACAYVDNTVSASELRCIREHDLKNLAHVII